MITFKDVEKDFEKKQMGEGEESNNSSDKEKRKKYITYAIIGGVALVVGYYIYTKVLVKSNSGSISAGGDIPMAEF